MSSGHQTDAKTVFTPEQVSRHNNEHDLWMVIRRKVYDVTKFAYEVVFKLYLVTLISHALLQYSNGILQIFIVN